MTGWELGDVEPYVLEAVEEEDHAEEEQQVIMCLAPMSMRGISSTPVLSRMKPLSPLGTPWASALGATVISKIMGPWI